MRSRVQDQIWRELRRNLLILVLNICIVHLDSWSRIESAGLDRNKALGLTGEDRSCVKKGAGIQGGKRKSVNGLSREGSD